MADFDCVSWHNSDVEEDAACVHIVKLALACGVINTPEGTLVRVVKYTRICDDCHTACISRLEQSTTTCKDASQFYVFEDGKCCCGN